MKHLDRCTCFLFVLYGLVARYSAEHLTLSINFDKPVSITDEKFLSLTVDPATLLTGSALSEDYERSVNLARSLTPAYVRLGGPRSSDSHFGEPNVQDDEKNGRIVLSEFDWVLMHQWAKKAGLDVIACISLDDEANDAQDSENTSEIISFSDRVALNSGWQLGYECQTRCNISADDLARRTMYLRQTLNKFPRYANSRVIGPDIVTYNGEKQRQYLRDYFDVAAPALSAITWHPDFATVTLDNEGAFIHQDDLEKDKEELLKVIGRFVDKQPLWIAESKPEECKNLYIGALILTRRLGNAARSKINVLMRQPSDLTQSSPDYWVSLLHKTLVGREVFEAKTQLNNKNHVYLYCQCTKPSNTYERGSVTIFGVNLNPEEAIVHLKGMKVDTVHEYLLSPGLDAPNRMFSQSVFLNNRTLTLINDTVPELYPVILHDPEGLSLAFQPGDIGFWVLPDLKIKSCMEDDGISIEDISSISRGIQELNSAEDTKIHVTRSVEQDLPTPRNSKKQKLDSLSSRKMALKRELKKLQKFARNKLNDPATAKRLPKREDPSTPKPETENGDDTTQAPGDDTRSKLQEFKDRISKIRNRSVTNQKNRKNSIDNIVTNVTSLISKVQDALQSARQGANPSGNAKDHLKSLHNFVRRVNLNQLTGKPKLSTTNEGSKVFKRDVYDILQDPANRSKKRSRNGDEVLVDDPRIVEREIARQVVRPRMVHLANSDSEERTFYGFFKMNPVEGFPEGDVFFAAGDLPRDTDYGYPKADEARSGHIEPDPSEPNYAETEDFWADNGEDYPYYDPVEYFGNARMSNDRARSNSRHTPELWEAETVETPREGRLRSNGGQMIGRHPPSPGDTAAWPGSSGYQVSPHFLNNHGRGYDTSLTRPSISRPPPVGRINYADRQGFTGHNHRRIDQNPGMPDYDGTSLFEEPDLPMENDYPDVRRTGREATDLHAVLDQEMIKEDDANSKDCKCRVIRRSRRSNTESVESVTDPEVEALNSHDLADVEVFAELKESPMEATKSRTDSSSVEVEQSDLEGNPNDKFDAAVGNPQNYYAGTLSGLPMFSLTSNGNGRTFQAPILDQVGIPDQVEPKKNEKQTGNVDLEGVPRETTETAPGNLENHYTEVPLVVTPTTVTSTSTSTANENRQSKTPTRRKIGAFRQERLRRNRKKSTNLNMKNAPIGTVGSVSGNVENYSTVTPPTVPLSTLPSNEDGHPIQTLIPRDADLVQQVEPVINEKQVASLDSQGVPSDKIDETSENVEGNQFGTPFIVTPLSFISKEDDQSFQEAVPQEAEIFLDEEFTNGEDQAANLDLEQVASETVSVVPENPEDVQLDGSSTVLWPPLPLNEHDAEDSTESLKNPVRRQGGELFREETGPNRTEATAQATSENPANYSSKVWENSETSTGEKVAKETVEESSTVTLDSTALWQQDIAKESEMDHYKDQVAAASSKREVVNEQPPKVSTKVPNRSSTSSPKGSWRARRQRQNQSSRRTKSNVVSARQAQLIQRAKVLSAVARMIRGKTGHQIYEYSPRRSKNQRAEGTSRYREGDKSRERKMMSQRYQKDIDDEVDEATDEEDRNLKRREVWEMIEDSDDVRDTMDCEKLACVLVYKPNKDEYEESHESIEKRDVPMTEVVRARNVRQRIFGPKGQRDLRESTIKGHSNPYGTAVKEIVELKDLYESQGGRIDRSMADDDEDDGKTYFALVENLDRPRIFRLREKERDGKRKTPSTSPYSSLYHDHVPNHPRSKSHHEILKTFTLSSDQHETESDKTLGAKKLYIIDPAKYRGGEPILEPYKEPSKSRSDSMSKHLKEAIRNALRKPYKIRKIQQHKREDAAGKGNDTETSTETEDQSRDASTGQLLKLMIDNLDLQSVEELFKQLSKYNKTAEKHEFIRSIVDEINGKRAMEKDAEEPEVDPEHTDISKDRESIEEARDREELIDPTESYQDVSIEREKQSGEQFDSNVEVSFGDEYSAELVNDRQRRDTSTESERYYSKWYGSLLVPETSSNIRNTGRDNRLIAKEDTKDTTGGSSYNEENLDDVSPVYTNDNSLNVLKDDVDADRKNDEDVDLKHPRQSDKSDGTITIPWTRKFGRFRRQAVDQKKVTENTDMAQPSELQHLEGSSSPRIHTSGEMDDVEKSLVRKIPIERYTKKEDQTDRKKSLREKDDQGLSSLIQKTIPSLQNVVIDGLQKAKNFTESVEQLIENVDEEFKQTTSNDEEKDWNDSKPTGTSRTMFRNAMTNVKKFFAFLGGITKILRG